MPENSNAVPNVIGRPVRRAASILKMADYACNIKEIRLSDSVSGGRVLKQNPEAGKRGYIAQSIQLIVALPYSLDALPANCVDRTEGS